jgi:hypothetical protein
MLNYLNMQLGLGKITGGFITSNKVNKETLSNLVKTQSFLQNNIGLSEEGAQSFELYAAGMGQSSEEALVKINEMSTALEEFTGIRCCATTISNYTRHSFDGSRSTIAIWWCWKQVRSSYNESQIVRHIHGKFTWDWTIIVKHRI